MYYQNPHAKGGTAHKHAGRRWHPHALSIQRAPVNIYKIESGYEMLVFAPGRVKELFQMNIKGKELSISYHPAPASETPEWVRKEYSRGAFERVFELDENIDASGISARYENGVLQVSLPLIPGQENPKQDIPIK